MNGWHREREQATDEAEHRIVESALRYDAVRDDTFRLIKRLMVQVHALDQQITLYEEGIIPKAEQTLRVSTADYRVGKVDFQQIIDNFSSLLMFQIQLARFQATLGQTLASLERVVGCQLAAIAGEEPSDEAGAPQLVAPPQPAESPSN